MKPESLGDFLAWRPPFITQLIGNGILIPQGKIILFGPYKSWKSMTAIDLAFKLSNAKAQVMIDAFQDFLHSVTAIDLAFKLSSGKPWLGFKTTLSTVLVIQLEIPKTEYQKRVNKYCFGNKLSPLNNLFFVTIRNLKLDKGWGVEMLNQWITETKAQVVIIDPIYKVVSGHLTSIFTPQISQTLFGLGLLLPTFLPLM